MNYTTNYHLPQWVETDRIMMEDFNDAMSDIDQGIKTGPGYGGHGGEQGRRGADHGQRGGRRLHAGQQAIRDRDLHRNGYGTQEITLGFSPSITIISGEV